MFAVLASLSGACAFDSSGVGGEDSDTLDPSATSSTMGSTGATDATVTTTVTTTESTTADTTAGTTDDPTGTDPSATTTGSTGDASSSETGPDVPGWWNPEWSSRRRIDLVLPDGVPGPLSAVPLMILLNDSRIDYGELQLRGQDLRFVDADDDTVLPHEIERWNPDGTSVAWVQIPEYEADDFIYMYWGNADVPGGANPAALWTPGFAGVWHLDEDPADDAPQFHDSSPGARDATAQGGMTVEDLVMGNYTPAIDFDGSDDKALVGQMDTDAWTELTVSAWFFHRDNGDDRAVSKAFGTGANDHVFMIGAHDDDVKVRVRSDAGTVELRPADTLPFSEWRHVALTWSADAGEAALFIDGEPVVSEALGGASLGDGNADVYIANVNAGDSRYWNGFLDEVRIEHDARDPEWIRTQFASLTDALATYGAEEQVP